jgi:hypothetical protein
MIHVLRVALALLVALSLHEAVGAEMFWGSLFVAAGAVYLLRVPFIWIPLGLMVIGGLLTAPFLFLMLVVGFGMALQVLPKFLKGG